MCFLLRRRDSPTHRASGGLPSKSVDSFVPAGICFIYLLREPVTLRSDSSVALRRAVTVFEVQLRELCVRSLPMHVVMDIVEIRGSLCVVRGLWM